MAGQRQNWQPAVIGSVGLAAIIAAYATTVVVLIALDSLWLGVIAKPIYQQGIGHLMATRPNLAVALLFYAVFAAGLLLFAVAPGGVPGSWGKTLISALLFGFFAYATYDLSNLATLKDWPVGMSAVDIVWGSLLSAVSAAAGKAALDQFAANLFK